MNKNLIIGAIVIVIIVLAGAGAYMMMGANSNPQPAQQTQTEADTQAAANGPKSLRDLMGLANNQTCTFTDAESSSTGTVYAGGGKVRGDFSTTTGTTTTVSHVFSDGTDFYMWADGEAEGLKVSLASFGDLNAQSTDPKTKSADPDKQVDFRCTPGTVDTAMFTLPNIEFTDFSEMMMAPSGMMMEDEEGMMDLKAAQCAACDNLPPDASAQCKQALSC